MADDSPGFGPDPAVGNGLRAGTKPTDRHGHTNARDPNTHAQASYTDTHTQAPYADASPPDSDACASHTYASTPNTHSRR